MTYSISGLSPEPFSPLFALDDTELATQSARRVVADSDSGFPCRVSLEDARAGEKLILLHYTSHDVATPYRSAYAIYVREHAAQPDPYIDITPPVFKSRALSLRGFGSDGMVVLAKLAPAGEADSAIRDLFANPAIAYIHAYNAVYGCFSAQIDRHGDSA